MKIDYVPRALDALESAPIIVRKAFFKQVGFLGTNLKHPIKQRSLNNNPMTTTPLPYSQALIIASNATVHVKTITLTLAREPGLLFDNGSQTETLAAACHCWIS